MALVVGVFVAFKASIKVGVLVGVTIWAAGWSMFGLAMKYRWGLRPDIEDAARLSFRRPFAQASDRWLAFLMSFLGLSVVVLTIGLATGMDRVTGIGGWFPLGLDILFTWVILSERRRRSTR